MKVLWTGLKWIIYLALGALSLYVAGWLIVAVLAVSAVALGIALVVGICVFVAYCVKEYFNPSLGPIPRDKQ